MLNIGKKIMAKKKILILGASSDIGVKTVEKFLKMDWIVIAHYNQNLKNLSRIKNSNLKTFKFDLKKINKFNNFISTNKFFKNIDSFISLTGYLKPVNFFKLNLKNFTDHVNVNYLANIIIMQKIIPFMRKRKFGRILLSSSVGVKFGGSNNSIIYSLTKHMNEFFFSSFKEFYKDNVLINTIRIGVTDTKIHKKKGVTNMKRRINLIPIKRIAEPSEIVEYLYFYGSEKNTFTTKSLIEVTGGE